MSEPNELVDGYDPADPPQGEHWCSECCRWDDECECDPDDEQPEVSNLRCNLCGKTSDARTFDAAAKWIGQHECK